MPDASPPALSSPPAHPAAPLGRRERLGGFLFLALALLAAGTWYIVRADRTAAGLVAREDAALVALREVVRREREHRERTGRYGTVDDLSRAGALGDLALGGEGPHRWVVAAGGAYRIDVLLPYGILSADAVLIAPPGGRETPSPELAARHFAAVARPVVPGRDGHRTWYLDELEVLYLNEGAVDDEGEARNLLPGMLVRRPVGLDTAQWLLWQRADAIATSGE